MRFQAALKNSLARDNISQFSRESEHRISVLRCFVMFRDGTRSLKGRNVGVSRKLDGTKKRDRPDCGESRVLVTRGGSGCYEVSTGLGGVCHGIVPPLINTWKQGNRRRATGEERERINYLYEARNT